MLCRSSMFTRINGKRLLSGCLEDTTCVKGISLCTGGRNAHDRFDLNEHIDFSNYGIEVLTGFLSILEIQLLLFLCFLSSRSGHVMSSDSQDPASYKVCQTTRPFSRTAMSRKHRDITSEAQMNGCLCLPRSQP